MRKRRLSIFSFETLKLNGARPAGFFRAIILTLALLFLSNLSAYLLMITAGQYGKYWDVQAGVKLEAYRQVVQHTTPEILIVGDSTGALDIDPEMLLASLPPGLGAYNLAIQGNFPMAFRCTDLPFLSEPHAPPKLVIVSFRPVGFTDNFDRQDVERRILDSAYCRGFGASLFDLKSLRLTSLTHTISCIRKHDPIGANVQQESMDRGFNPVAGIKEKNPTEKQQKQVQDTVKVDVKRFRIIRDLARLARERQFKVLFVIPPTSDTKEGAALVAELNKTKDTLGIMVGDYSHPSFLSIEHYYDEFHLNAEGAKIYSKELSKLIVSYFEAENGSR